MSRNVAGFGSIRAYGMVWYDDMVAATRRKGWVNVKPYTYTYAACMMDALRMERYSNINHHCGDNYVMYMGRGHITRGL